jgi:hypothetical protein
MAQIGLSRIPGVVKEPLRAYSFEVELPRDFGDADRLKYQVKSVEFPVWFDLEVEGVRAGGLGFYFLPDDFSGKAEVRVEFWEDVELSVQRYFNKWRSKMVVESVVGTPYRELRELPSKWMKDVLVHVLDVKGKRVGSYRLRKCYPISIDAMRLGYAENEVVSVSVSLVVHGIELE